MGDYSELKTFLAHLVELDCTQCVLEIANVQALIAENEALRKDAERYRWLRKPSNTWDDHFDVNTLDYWIVGSREEVDNTTGNDLDNSIDYFMGKEAGRG